MYMLLHKQQLRFFYLTNLRRVMSTHAKPEKFVYVELFYPQSSILHFALIISMTFIKIFCNIIIKRGQITLQRFFD